MPRAAINASPLSGWLSTLFVGLLLVALPMPEVAAQQAGASAAVSYREYLLDIHYRGEQIGELTPALFPEETSRETLTRQPLILAAGVLAALGVRFQVGTRGQLEGVKQPGDIPFSYFTDGRYRIDNVDGLLGAEDLVVRNGELYLSVSAFSLLLPVRLRADERTQRLVVDSTGPLSLDLARNRLLAQAALDSRELISPLPLTRFPYRPLGRLTGDVGLSAQRGTAQAGARFGYDGLLTTEIGYATALMSFHGNEGESISDIRLRLGRETPSGGILGIPGLTSAFGGDVTRSGPALVGSDGGRGLTLSAYPLDRPDSFDRTTVEGDAPPGWEAELFRGEQLLAYGRVSADGRYRFEDVPLLFGDNALRVALHGPNGQLQQVKRTFRVGSGMTPPGTIYWRVFMGERSSRLLDSLLPDRGREQLGGGIYAAEADVGITQWLSANVFAARAAESYQLDSPLRQSYGGGLRIAFPLAYLELDLAQQHRTSLSPAAGRAWSLSGITRLGGIDFSVRHAEFDDFLSQRAMRGTAALRTHTEVRGTTWLPLPRIPLGLSLHAERWQLSNGDTESSVSGQVRFSAGAIYLTQELSRRRFSYGRSSATGQSVDWKATASVNIDSRLRVSASTDYSISQHHLDQVMLSGNYRIDGKTVASLAMTGSKIRESGTDYSVTLGISRDFGKFWGSAGVTRQAEGSYMSYVGLNFGFGFDREGNPRFSSRRQAQLGRAEVFVFHDVDGNGIYDSQSDAALPGVGVRVEGRGGTIVKTKPDGWAYVEGLSVTKPVTLDIDPASIPDPFLAVAAGGVRFIARPGSSFDVQMALVDTGSIEGKVFLERGAQSVPIASVVIDLVRLYEARDYDVTAAEGLSTARASGRPTEGDISIGGDRTIMQRVVKTVRSQYDGNFLFDLVPPGRYLIRVRPGQMLRGQRLDAAEVAAEITSRELTVENVDLRTTQVAVDQPLDSNGATDQPVGIPLVK